MNKIISEKAFTPKAKFAHFKNNYFKKKITTNFCLWNRSNIISENNSLALEDGLTQKMTEKFK